MHQKSVENVRADKEGIIQYAYYGDSGSDNPKIEELLEAIRNLQ